MFFIKSIFVYISIIIIENKHIIFYLKSRVVLLLFNNILYFISIYNCIYLLIKSCRKMIEKYPAYASVYPGIIELFPDVIIVNSNDQTVDEPKSDVNNLFIDNNIVSDNETIVSDNETIVSDNII